MVRTFHILNKVDASEETWAYIDDAVERIFACDTKSQIEDICLSTLDLTDGKLNDNFAIVVVGKLDWDTEDAIDELGLRCVMCELVCPPSATLSLYSKVGLLEDLELSEIAPDWIKGRDRDCYWEIIKLGKKIGASSIIAEDHGTKYFLLELPEDNITRDINDLLEVFNDGTRPLIVDVVSEEDNIKGERYELHGKI